MSANETEKDRILRMVAEGVLRPNEAAQLLKAMSEQEQPAPAKPVVVDKTSAREPEREERKEPEKAPMTKVQIQRPDGSFQTIEVPMSLVPMVMKMAGVYIKESMRSAAKDTWDGMKIMAKNKAGEVRDGVKEKVQSLRPGGKEEEKPTASSPSKSDLEDTQAEARKRIMQMVQNGRLSIDDAARLLAEIDALNDVRKSAA